MTQQKAAIFKVLFLIKSFINSKSSLLLSVINKALRKNACFI